MAIPNVFKIINLNNIKNYYYISEIGEVYSTYSNKILINDVRQHERHFWNCLYGVASQEQIKRILDGHKVTISDTIYQIVEPEKS